MYGMPSKHQLTTDPVLIGWNASAVASLFLPLLIMIIARCVNVGDEDGNGDNNNNNDDNQDGNNNQGSWWKFWGNNNNNNNNGEQGGGSQDNQVPWWWFSASRERDPEDEGKGALIFVYIWSCLLFLSLVLYGNFVVRRNSEFEGLQAALIMSTNLAFMVMIMVAGLGAIRIEGRELEETGWYGQFSVCIFLTCLFWMINGIAFTVLLRKRNMNVGANYGRSVGSFAGLFRNPLVGDSASDGAKKGDDAATQKAFEYERERGDV